MQNYAVIVKLQIKNFAECEENSIWNVSWCISVIYDAWVCVTNLA